VNKICFTFSCIFDHLVAFKILFNVYCTIVLSNHIALDKKVIIRWLHFPQVVQKQTLGEVGN